MERRRMIRASAVLMVFLLLTGLVEDHAGKIRGMSGIALSNREEITASIRTGFREHSPKMTIRFPAHVDGMDEMNGMVEDLVEQALAETGDGQEGDYLRYQYGGYENHYSYERGKDGIYRYTVELTPEYYTTIRQEAEVTETLDRVMDSLDLESATTQEEKVHRIYDYVYEHVSYDKVHRKNPAYHLKLTAYGALIYGRAVCQGYCVLLYRMFSEAGIPSRIVTGTAEIFGNQDSHSWNIVELDGMWYNLDCTWDKALEEENYYLVGEKHFGNHMRDEAFQTEAFLCQYPMSETDYR